MTRRGRVKPDAGDEEVTGTPAIPVARRAAWMTAAATITLWALVITGAVGGVAGWVVRPNGAGAAPAVVRSATGPAGWAQAFVAAFLTAGEGQEERLRMFFPAVPSLAGVTAGARAAGQVTVLRAGEVAAGYWTVTVAVDELARGVDGGLVPDGVACYRVSLVARGDAAAGGTGQQGDPVGYSATRMPDRVACPPALDDAPALAYASAVDPDDPVGDVVRRFLAALLTGAGDVRRYTSPTATIRPINPVPYTGVETVEMRRETVPGLDVARPAEGQRLAVLATVRVASATAIQLLSYPLRLVARADRWEVAALPGAPPLDDDALPAVPAASPPAVSPSPLPSLPPSPSPSPSPAAVTGAGAGEEPRPYPSITVQESPYVTRPF
ncbi:hypothetical protein [Parafrankia sp. FMc2]|uniref:hypothetical protein n=1 Tax=Parafrankia sp. FMc2 TaxID=3233196 RepID=UPI0034D56C4B